MIGYILLFVVALSLMSFFGLWACLAIASRADLDSENNWQRWLRDAGEFAD